MSQTAYERHLDRAHALMTRRVRSGAASLAGEIASAPVTNAAMRAVRGEVATALSRAHEHFSAGFAEALKQSFDEFIMDLVLDK